MQPLFGDTISFIGLSIGIILAYIVSMYMFVWSNNVPKMWTSSIILTQTAIIIGFSLIGNYIGLKYSLY